MAPLRETHTMFERLKSAFSARPQAVDADEALAQWARERLLNHMALLGGAYALGGRLHDRLFRAECIATSRVYMQGMELMAKADLGLSPDVTVIVMNRALKRSLEALANELYAEATDTLRTTRKALPEEVRWLSMFRDAGWPGPDGGFWGRYAVLTDSPETARHWLDAASITMLMDWPGEPGWDAPRLFMLARGKTYLRMQVGQPGDSSPALHALDIFEHLSGNALKLLEH
jgi:hypothetical protein